MSKPGLEARHTAHHTTLRFSTEVNMESVRWLVDEVQHARTYLRHTHVTVELDSHGGSSHGLEYWLHNCRRWSADPGFTLATRAVGAAESAAAIILSHGTVGARSALPTARLLYHGARIVTSGHEVWTGDRLRLQHGEMHAVNHRMLTSLAAHCGQCTAPGAGDADTALLERYTDLWQRDAHITPAEALAHGLIDAIDEA